MGIIDIEQMYQEMSNTMQNNFHGSAETRYFLAKMLFLKSVDKCIEDNKKDLIKEIVLEDKE